MYFPPCETCTKFKLWLFRTLSLLTNPNDLVPQKEFPGDLLPEDGTKSFLWLSQFSFRFEPLMTTRFIMEREEGCALACEFPVNFLLGLL
jgi:hypothetical protein